jgi:RND superfamily putative drug exporter
MELLGDRNWWLPGWLERILPHIDVDGHALDDEDVEMLDLVGGAIDDVDEEPEPALR